MQMSQDLGCIIPELTSENRKRETWRPLARESGPPLARKRRVGLTSSPAVVCVTSAAAPPFPGNASSSSLSPSPEMDRCVRYVLIVDLTDWITDWSSDAD